MENIDIFLSKIALQFEDTDVNEITKNAKFKDLEEWSSLTSMAIIAFIKTEYGKSVTGSEIRACITFEDLYHLIDSK